ncbi:MAG: hypothetical protein C0454_04430 [Parvibaculum sp.]|nr:hypothetical protein [Parvibaculum sp.]
MTTIGKLTLPEQFPGYDVYIWSDADIWFQESDGLAWLSEAASTGAMAVVPELDRCYRVPDPAGVLKWRLDRMRIAVGWRLARKLIHFPYMNGGLFALSSDAPHWKEWQVGYGKAIGSGRFTGGIAQGYLIKMLFQDGLPHVPLPASCNWMCHLAEPLWDKERHKFVEPFTPHSVIQGIHLTSRTKNDARFRFDRERSRLPRISGQS